MLPFLLKDVNVQTIFDLDEEEEPEEEEEPSSTNAQWTCSWPCEVGEAGCPLDFEQTWGTRSWQRDTDGAQSVARRARFVHRRRADRTEMAQELKDWIFVLDSLRAWPRPS